MQRSEAPVKDQQLIIKTPYVEHDRALDPNYSNYQAALAYVRGGFTQTKLDRSDPDILMRRLCSDGVVLRMPKYTWKIAWIKHYNAISPVPRQGGQGDKIMFYKNIVKDIISELSLQPSNHMWKSNSRDHLTCIEGFISTVREKLVERGRNMEDLPKRVVQGIMETVAKTTRISLGLIMHLVSARLKKASSVITMFETTTEILQCIVIQLVSARSQKRLFCGDLHTCQLHCTRCGRSFGIIDTLEKVLANAQWSILAHYDLQVHNVAFDTYDHLFQNVLPPIFASSSNLSAAVRQLQKSKDKLPTTGGIMGCRYGTNNARFDQPQKRNNQIHNSNFTEAVNMDASFYLSDDTDFDARVHSTATILGELFHTMDDACEMYHDLDQKDGSETKEGSAVANTWEQWFRNEAHHKKIESILPSSNVPWFEELDARQKMACRSIQSFSYLLDMLFKNNVALALGTSVDGANIDNGLKKQLKELLGIPDEYNAFTFGDEIKMKMGSKNITVNRDDCFLLRPIQRNIQIEEVEPYSVTGAGWDCPEAINWFKDNPAEKQGARSVSAQTMAEDELIYKTMTHVKWKLDTDGAKLYFFKCDMNNESQTSGFKHKKLAKIEEFPCSQQFIKSMPFKAMSRPENAWINITRYLKPIRKRIKQARAKTIGGLKCSKLQWGESPLFEVYKKEFEEKEYDRVLVKGKDLGADLSKEPWVFNIMRRLSSVGSHRTLTLGEGSRSKVGDKMNEEPVYLEDDEVYSCDDNLQDNPPDSKSVHPSQLPVFNNFWWCSDNSSKCCVHGCIANLLHHMGATENAQSFKNLVTLDEASLLHALKLSSFPKAVVSNTSSNRQVDKLQLCLWLLRSRYNVKFTRSMDVEKFTSITTMVDILMKFKFPVILSMNITETVYRHVICVWQGMIIDFEQKTTYPLTTNNVEFSCGKFSTFVNLHCGYGLLPSKAMNVYVQEKYGISNDGMSDYLGKQQIFFQKATRKRKWKR